MIYKLKACQLFQTLVFTGSRAMRAEFVRRANLGLVALLVFIGGNT